MHEIKRQVERRGRETTTLMMIKTTFLAQLIHQQPSSYVHPTH